MKERNILKNDEITTDTLEKFMYNLEESEKNSELFHDLYYIPSYYNEEEEDYAI